MTYTLTVTGALLGNVSFVSAGAGCSIAVTTATCTAATLANGASVAYTVTVVAPSSGASVTNTASVASNTADLFDADDSDTLVTTLPADLSLTQSADPIVGRTRQPLAYEITVTNNGPGLATSITVTDTLPGSTAFVSASGTCTHSGQALGGTVTCTAASLSNSANVAFTITVTAPAVFGPISNTATVSAASPADPTFSNDTVTLVTSVLGFPPVPAIGTWALGGLALTFAAFVFFARRRRANAAR